MVKKEMGKEIRELLYTLTIGNREEVRIAKKELEKIWRKNTKEFKSAAPIALEYLPKFDQIKKAENQAAFASSLSLFFLVLGDGYFDTLKDFTLRVLQHPNGSVREAIRRTAERLFISLVSRAEPFVYPEGKKLTEKQKAMQAQAQLQYINLVKEIEFLIDKYDEETEGVKFIDEMKPSINKSLQLFWSRLTESRAYQKIVEQALPIPDEIVQKRKDIEDELIEMLKEAGSDFKTLGGLSPAEKLLDYQKMRQKGRNLPN